MNMDQRAKYRQAVRDTNEQPQAIKRHASTYNGLRNSQFTFYLTRNQFTKMFPQHRRNRKQTIC